MKDKFGLLFLFATSVLAPVHAADFPRADDEIRTLVADANGMTDDSGWSIKDVEAVRTRDDLLVAWIVTDSNTKDIYVQRFDPDTLAPRFPAKRVHHDTASTTSSDLVTDPSGSDRKIRGEPQYWSEHRGLTLVRDTKNDSVLVAWPATLLIHEGTNWRFNGYHIVGRLLARDNTLSDARWLNRNLVGSVTAPEGSAYDFDIAANDDGSFLLAFAYDTATSPSQNNALLYGQVLDETGDVNSTIAVSSIYIDSSKAPVSRIQAAYDPLSEGYQLTWVRTLSYNSVLTVPVNSEGEIRRTTQEVGTSSLVERNMLFRDPDSGYFLSAFNGSYRRIKPFAEAGTTNSMFVDALATISAFYPDFGSFDLSSGTVFLAEANYYGGLLAAIDVDAPSGAPFHSQLNPAGLYFSSRDEFADTKASDHVWRIYTDNLTIKADRWMPHRVDLELGSNAQLSVESGAVAEHALTLGNVAGDLGDFENTAKQLALDISWKDDSLPLEADGCELDADQAVCTITGSLMPLENREITFRADTSGVDPTALPKTFVMHAAASSISTDTDTTNDTVNIEIAVAAKPVDGGSSGGDSPSGDTSGSDSTDNDSSGDASNGDSSSGDSAGGATSPPKSGGGGALGAFLLLLLVPLRRLRQIAV